MSAHVQEDSITQQVASRIYSEKLRLVYDATLWAGAAIIVAIGFLTYLFDGILSHAVLYGWDIYMLIVVMARAIIYYLFARTEDQGNNVFWGRLAIVMAGLTGIGWGMCTVLFFPALTFAQQMVLILMITAYSAGALTSTFAIPAALFMLILPAQIPLVLFIFAIPGKTPFAIGSMLVFFLVFVFSATGRLHRLVTRSLQLRFENESLVKYLQKEKDNSEQLNRSLRKEVEERKEAASKLVVARKEAEQASMAKTQFLANMSHDIRTPMNGIIGMTRLVLETELSPEQKKFVDNIRISAEGLLGLLNDILDFSKIEAGQLLVVSQDFNFKKMLADVHATMAYDATEKGLVLNFPDNAEKLPSFVKGDELRLRQILINLLGNAIKFTSRGSVTLQVTAAPRDDGIRFHFVIQDTGPGIPKEKQEEIFIGFNQADSSTTREFGGSGLGLTICKQLVEMMGGTIWLDSEVGQGARFQITITLAKGSEENIGPADTVKRPKKKLQILLADDNVLNRELAQLILENDEHTVTSAENGLQALQYMETKRFDLILMDVQMPVMDGLTTAMIIRECEREGDLTPYPLADEAAVTLRKMCRGHHIPIIAMTAHAMKGDREKCLDAGMDGYLTKPFDPVQVQQVIADCMT